ncbi:sulfotransferase [Candidatus Pelagibacter sp.]|nr:sulfotransferase [Candidatus Pelagibacter sp.]
MHKAPSKTQVDTLLKYYKSNNYTKTKEYALILTEQFPDHDLGWKILSIVFEKTGKISESLTAIKKIVNISPKDPLAYYNLGNTYGQLADFSKAEESYRKAISLKPNFPEAYYNLGTIFEKNLKLEDAEKYYKQAISLKPDFADAYNNLGIVLEDLRKLNESEVCFKKVITLTPNFAEAYHNLGNNLEQQGKLKDAQMYYEKATIINPGLAKTHRQLSSIKKFDKYDDQYHILQKLYLDKNISKEQLCHINFSLAKIYEDLGNFEKAFKHFEEGNKIQKKLLNYNIKKDIELFNQIKLNFKKIEKNIPSIKRNKNDLTPVFIIGMPRSGTTLVEQIISSHSKVSGLGELPFVQQFGLKIATSLLEYNSETVLKFRNNYLEKIKNLSEKSLIITDKMPQNFLYIGLIATSFPEAKILHIKRNPAAVCWANYKQWFKSKDLSYSYSINDIIKYYRLYDDLMNFWKKLFNNRIYEVDYESLTVNHVDEIKKLIKYLDLNWEERCLSPEKNKRAVTTASNKQIRDKIFKGSSQKWKNYRAFLNGTLDNLEKK